MKKEENESSDEVLEAVKCLFSEASNNIPDACIGCAHYVSRTDDTVVVNFVLTSSPWLNKSQVRPSDQGKQICKQPFQCWFCICWHQLTTQNPFFK